MAAVRLAVLVMGWVASVVVAVVVRLAVSTVKRDHQTRAAAVAAAVGRPLAAVVVAVL